MSRSGLTPEQNERLRDLLHEVLRKPENTQKIIAIELGMTQSGLSSFLSGRAGTTYPTVEKLAKLLKMQEWEVLGKAPPDLADLPGRELAAALARQAGIGEAAIAQVMAEPLTAATERWPALWWADRMRMVHLELLAKTGEPRAKKKSAP